MRCAKPEKDHSMQLVKLVYLVSIGLYISAIVQGLFDEANINFL